MSSELFQKYRPKNFDEMVGQGPTLHAVGRMIEMGKCPHAIMLTGQTGCGKTSTGRIIADMMGCKPQDYKEVNAAKNRGIDDVRELASNMNIMPWGKCKFYHLDEAHMLTPEAQTALLKTLEDPPSTVYILLSTTNPTKVLPTVRNRCTSIHLSPLSDADMGGLIHKVAKAEGHGNLQGDVVDRIIELAEGSSRKALVMLETALQHDDEEGMLAAIGKAAGFSAAEFDLVKALQASDYKACARILLACDDAEPEGMRRMVLAYFRKAMLTKGNEATFKILKAFECDYFASVKAGLVISCWEACRR